MRGRTLDSAPELSHEERFTISAAIPSSNREWSAAALELAALEFAFAVASGWLGAALRCEDSPSPLSGIFTFTSVPSRSDSISRLPLRCRTRSRIPARPTPTPELVLRNCSRRSSGIPFPKSRIDRITFSASISRDNKWQFGSKELHLGEIRIEKPAGLFLKGVASGTNQSSLARGEVNSIALNVLKPSLVSPDLSRTQTDVRLLNLSSAWKNVTSRLRETIGLHFPSVEGHVRAIGAGTQFLGLADEAVMQATAPGDWPIWILAANSGLSWRSLSATLDNEEVIGVPDELNYVLGQSEYFEAGLRHVEQWRGPTCFVALQRHSDLWWRSASYLANNLLRNQGFVPTDLRFVISATGDDVPLICPVWRKRSKHTRPSQAVDLSSLLTQ